MGGPRSLNGRGNLPAGACLSSQGLSQAPELRPPVCGFPCSGGPAWCLTVPLRVWSKLPRRLLASGTPPCLPSRQPCLFPGRCELPVLALRPSPSPPAPTSPWSREFSRAQFSSSPPGTSQDRGSFAGSQAGQGSPVCSHWKVVWCRPHLAGTLGTAPGGESKPRGPGLRPGSLPMDSGAWVPWKRGCGWTQEADKWPQAHRGLQ